MQYMLWTCHCLRLPMTVSLNCSCLQSTLLCSKNDKAFVFIHREIQERLRVRRQLAARHGKRDTQWVEQHNVHVCHPIYTNTIGGASLLFCMLRWRFSVALSCLTVAYHFMVAKLFQMHANAFVLYIIPIFIICAKASFLSVVNGTHSFSSPSTSIPTDLQPRGRQLPLLKCIQSHGMYTCMCNSCRNTLHG